MQISSTVLHRPRHRGSSPIEAHSEPKSQIPTESFTFSSAGGSNKALATLAAAGAGIAGFALGSNGGWSGALAAIPAAGLALFGGTGVGLMVDISSGVNSNNPKIPRTLIGFVVGATLAGAALSGGAIGGTVGGLAVGAVSAVTAAGASQLLVDH